MMYLEVYVTGCSRRSYIQYYVKHCFEYRHYIRANVGMWADRAYLITQA